MFKQLFITALSLLLINFVLAQTSKTAVQYYNDGIKLQKEKKYTEAMSAYKNAIVKDAKYKEAMFSAGWTSNELKKYSEAVPYLLKAKTLWPNEAKVYLELGYAYEMLKKKTDAIENYNKCISLRKDYSLAYKYLAILYYDEYNYQKALDNFDLYLTYKPDSDDANIYYRKAVAENELGKYENALVTINKANDLSPDNVKLLNETGFTYYLLKNADDALTYYNKAFTLDPKSLTAANGRADVYRKLKKDRTEAIRLYAVSLALNSNNIKANYWTGWCYNELRKYNDAIPYLNKVIEIDDQYVEAYTELGYCDYALKKYDDALVNFKKAFAIKKTALNLYYTGLCFVGKKDRAAALKMVSDLKTMNSDYAADLKKAIDKL